MSVYVVVHDEHQSAAQSSYDEYLTNLSFSSLCHQSVHRQSVCHLPSRTAFSLSRLSPLSEEPAHCNCSCVDAVGNIAPTFFFASAMFNFVVLLHNLVSLHTITPHESCGPQQPAIPPHRQQRLIQQ